MMGGGSYSNDNSMKRRVANRWASDDLVRSQKLNVPKGYTTANQAETFRSRELHNEMNPFGVMLRESRDSAEHPESLAILIAMDETGSMGIVPDLLVKEGLPHLMNAVYQAGIQHPQVLFAGIGDHKCDSAPFQIGQYETNDELLDKWLTQTFLEGGGGGNGGESYALAWYFAGFRTAIDCHEKRGQKGVLITIGDEPCHRMYSARDLDNIFGGKEQFHDMSAQEMLAAAREKYHVFHVLIRETQEGSKTSTHDGWKEMMGDNLLIADSHKDVPKLITAAILSVATKEARVAEKATANAVTPVPAPDKPSEPML
jgi:hypothetical protein